MQKEVLMALSPTLWGGLLWIVTQIDLYLFAQGSITARQAIGHEALFFIFGLGSTLIVFVLCLKWLFAKHWLFAGLGLPGIFGFFLFLALTAKSGAAILNAT